MRDINYFYNESQTKSNTRKNILNSSLELFANNGIEKITMADIARISGITTRNLYRYYSSKESLVIDSTYLSFFNVNYNNFNKNLKLNAFEQLKEIINEYINLYSNKNNNINFTKYIMYFDIYITTIPKTDPNFIRYKEVYRPLIIDSNASLLKSILLLGSKDGTILIKKDEVDLYVNYINQSLFSLSMRINIKEYENELINETLLIKHKDIILGHLGAKDEN